MRTFTIIIILMLMPCLAFCKVYQFGSNPDLGTTLECVSDLGQNQTIPDTSGITTVVCDSTADGQAHGILSILVSGVDYDLNELNEIVTLSGATDTLTNEFMFIDAMTPITEKSDIEAAGNITAYVDTMAVCRITEGEKVSKSAIYIVPRYLINGKTLQYITITAWLLSVNKKQTASVDGFPCLRRYGTNLFIPLFNAAVSSTGNSTQDFRITLTLYPGDTIAIRASSTSTGTQVSASFFWIIVNQ